MIYRKKGLIIAISLIVSILLLIYTNNRQKSSFKVFIWNTQELTLGKLISISFLSGFLISTFMQNIFIPKNTKRKIKDEFNKSEEYESIPNNEDDDFGFEMPPQRDVRDTQPTISVNYRVVKNKENTYSKDSDKYTDNKKYRDADDDDWNSNVYEW